MIKWMIKTRIMMVLFMLKTMCLTVKLMMVLMQMLIRPIIIIVMVAAGIKGFLRICKVCDGKENFNLLGMV